MGGPGELSLSNRQAGCRLGPSMRIDRIDRHIHARVHLHLHFYLQFNWPVAAARTARSTLVEAENPYAPPKSDTLNAPEMHGQGVKKVFSPAQASLGAFFGGPLAGTYYVTMNFLSLGDKKRARLTTISGIIISVVALLGHHLLFERILGYSINIAYPVIAWPIIARMQFTKPQIAASRTLTFHSDWRVAGVALLGKLIILPLGAAESHLLAFCGITALP